MQRGQSNAEPASWPFLGSETVQAPLSCQNNKLRLVDFKQHKPYKRWMASLRSHCAVITVIRLCLA